MHTIRASSITTFLDCAHKFYGQVILGYTKPAEGPAAIGSAVHLAAATYDRAHMEGDLVEPSDVAAVVVDAIKHPLEEVNWRGISQKEAARIGIRVFNTYCNEVAPGRSYTAVEEELTPLVVEIEGVELQITGHPDRVQTLPQGELGIVDLKTGERAAGRGKTARVNHHIGQLGAYDLLLRASAGDKQVIAPEVIGLQTTKDGLVGTSQVPNAYNALVGTDVYPGILDYMATAFRTGQFAPNPTSLLCTRRYCPVWPRCPYHE